MGCRIGGWAQRQIKNLNTALYFGSAAALIFSSSIAMSPVASVQAATTQTLFSNGFESGFNTPDSWDSHDSEWSVIDSSKAYNGDQFARVGYDTTAMDAPLTKFVNTTGYQNIQLSFHYKHNGLETDDDVRIEFKYGDSNWQELSSVDDFYQVHSPTSFSYTQQTASFSDAVASNVSSFGVRLVGTMGTKSDQFDIDDVKITGKAIPDTTSPQIESLVPAGGSSVPATESIVFSADVFDEGGNLEEIYFDIIKKSGDETVYRSSNLIDELSDGTVSKTISSQALTSGLNFAGQGLDNGDLFTFQVRAIDGAEPENVNDKRTGDIQFGDSTNPAPITNIHIEYDDENMKCSGVIDGRTITVDWEGGSDTNFDHFDYQNKDGGTIKELTNSEFTGDIRDKDGEYKYRVRAVDKAGNTSEWSSWCHVTLDRDAPVVEITSHGDGDWLSSTHDGVVDIRGTINDDNPHHYYLEITGPNGYSNGPGVVNDSDPIDPSETLHSWDLNGVKSGDYTIKLAARDAAGNKKPAARGITYDPNDPSDSIDFVGVMVDNAAPEIAWKADGPVTTNDPSLEGNATDNLSGIDNVELQIKNGSETVQDWTAVGVIANDESFDSDDENFTATPAPATNLTDGAYTFKARATDEAGNVENTAEVQVIYDSRSPETTWNETGSTITNDAIPTLSGDAEDMHSDIAEVEFFAADSNGVEAPNWKTSSVTPEDADFDSKEETFTATPDSPLVSGVYTFLARATDEAGNTEESESIAMHEVTVDLLAPELNTDGNKTVEGHAYTLNGSANDNEKIGDPGETNVASREWTLVDGPGDVEFTESTYPDTEVSVTQFGAYEFEFAATDEAGNTATETVKITFQSSGDTAEGADGDNTDDDGSQISTQENDVTLLPSNRQFGQTQVLAAQTQDSTENQDENTRNEDNGDVLQENTDGFQNEDEQEEETAQATAEDTDFWWWILLITLLMLAGGGYIYWNRTRSTQE